MDNREADGSDPGDSGILVETEELDSGGVEIKIRFERAIELKLGAGRQVFNRVDNLASWLKEAASSPSEGLDREPGDTNITDGPPGDRREGEDG
jgi:hypothetical protein